MSEPSAKAIEKAMGFKNKNRKMDELFKFHSLAVFQLLVTFKTLLAASFFNVRSLLISESDLLVTTHFICMV